MTEKRFSKVVKVDGKQFRYDYMDCIVEYVSKADEEMLKDNERWQEKYGTNLWDIDADGYSVNSSAGLMRENWDDVSVRNEYLAEWSMELDSEAQDLAEQFLKYV